MVQSTVSHMMVVDFIHRMTRGNKDTHIFPCSMWNKPVAKSDNRKAGNDLYQLSIHNTLVWECTHKPSAIQYKENKKRKCMMTLSLVGCLRLRDFSLSNNMSGTHARNRDHGGYFWKDFREDLGDKQGILRLRDGKTMARAIRNSRHARFENVAGENWRGSAKCELLFCLRWEMLPTDMRWWQGQNWIDEGIFPFLDFYQSRPQNLLRSSPLFTT